MPRVESITSYSRDLRKSRYSTHPRCSTRVESVFVLFAASVRQDRAGVVDKVAKAFLCDGGESRKSFIYFCRSLLGDCRKR